MQKIKNHLDIIFIILAIAIAIPSVWPLIHTGFPLTDDGNWMVIRFSAFYETLRSGQFPVRFLMRLNNGFGYPVADFLYPLFMYIGVPLHVLGLNFVNTVKTILILSLILSSVFSFLWLRKIFDRASSLVGSFFYLYFPYHLFDAYKRGSVGEVLSLAVLPFVLWQLERKSFLWITIGIAALLIAHNTLAFLFLTVVVLYLILDIVIAKKRKERALWYLSSLVLGFGISSFFWLPALLDLKYTVFNQISVSDWSNYFADINLIGIPALLIITVTLIFIFTGKIKLKSHRLSILMLVILIASIALSTSLSTQLWTVLPVSFIQFPFRMLSLSIISGSFLIALLISLLSKKQKILVSLFSVAILFFLSLPYLQIENFQYFPDSFYSTNQDTTTVKNEYMPKWVKKIPMQNSNIKIQNLNGSESVNLLSQSVNKINFQTYLASDRTIQFNAIYFPGWVATNNGAPINISYDNSEGLMRVNLPKGQNNVIISFGETPLRLGADLISIISLVLVLFISFTFKKKRYNLI